MDFLTATREDLVDYTSSLVAEKQQLASDKQQLESKTQQLESKAQQLESTVQNLKEQVKWLKTQLFGHKSERHIPQDPRQGNLFEVPDSPPPESTTVKDYERSARRKPTDTNLEGKLRFGPEVPVEEEIVLPKEVKGLSEDDYEVIGEKVTERLHQTPAQYKVKRTIRKTVKLKEAGSIHTEAAPAAVIERSFADVSFLTSLLVDKFHYHLPLYRQHQRLKTADIHISRGHLTRLVHRSLELLEPIYYAVLSSVLSSEFVSMDETPIKASRKQKGKMHTAYFWPVFADEQVAFIYQDSRRHGVVAEVLGDTCKKLLSDGYQAYEQYAATREGFVHANCWAHARRYFFEAQEHSPEECHEVLEMIKKLFAIERERKDPAELDLTRMLRRTRSTPVVDKLFQYLDTLWFEKMVDPATRLGKAISYTRDREVQLRAYLEHPDIPISNNHVERAIRPLKLGAKNWLFCWSEVGAKYTAIAYTLIECCKLHKVDTWKYLCDVLQRIDTHKTSNIQLLTPKQWKEHFA